MNEQHLSWRPSAETSKRLMFYAGILLAIIGAIVFGLSFDSVMIAARPVFGAASWAVPTMMDTTLAALTVTSVVLELNGLRARSAQYFARVLIGLTVYANTATAHGVFARVLHAGPPLVWAGLVLIGEQTVRRLVGLSDENRIEGVRKSLWLLRPVATWRLWRQMRIHQITTYRDALDRDAARAAVTGRLRVAYGRFWRQNAPLAERIALRLEGRDPAGVAKVLTDHQTTTALLSGTYLEPATEAASEPSEGSAPKTRDETRYETSRPRARSGRRSSAKRTPARRTDEQLLAAASALEAQTGEPLPVRRLMTEYAIGQDRAKRVRERLDAAALPAVSETTVIPAQSALEYVPESASESGPVPRYEYANGAVAETYEDIVARL